MDFSERAGGIEFAVHAQPRAGRSEIAGEHDGRLRVRLAAPPVRGAANQELIRVLAKALGVPRSAVEIARGRSARTKTVRVRGVTAAEARRALRLSP
ncbi:MAG: DUF167 domain-containing protein [Gemmatimonadetes bacterium]|nr:DUF167 domain-containing protein [Gemmatimonadota bacterium]